MKFPKIDTTLWWSMIYSLAAALILTLFFGLAYMISWALAFIVFFMIANLFLYPVMERELEWDDKPEPADVIETALEMLTEDEDENTETDSINSSIDY